MPQRNVPSSPLSEGVAFLSPQGPSENPAAPEPGPAGAGGQRAAPPARRRPAQRAALAALPAAARLPRARGLRVARLRGAHERAGLPLRARHAVLRLLQLRAPQAVHRGAEPRPRVGPRHAGLEPQLLQPPVAHVPDPEAVRPRAGAALRTALQRRGRRSVVPVLAVAPAAAPRLQPHDGLPGARRVPAAAATAAAPQPGPGVPVRLARSPLRPQPDARGLPQRPAALTATRRGRQRPGPAQGRRARVSDSPRPPLAPPPESRGASGPTSRISFPPLFNSYRSNFTKLFLRSYLTKSVLSLPH